MSGSRNTLFEPLRITDPSTSDNPLLSTADAIGGGAIVADQGTALADLYTRLAAEHQRQMQISRERGLWTGGEVWQGGHPTMQGVADIGGQYTNALLLGTSAPKGPALSLERTTLPKEWAQPNNHKFTINRAGEEVGSVHTEWDPQTGELYIQDIESAGGPNAYGPGAIRELRDALLEHYPEARTISGYRTTGAGADRETFQRIKRYQGRE